MAAYPQNPRIPYLFPSPHLQQTKLGHGDGDGDLSSSNDTPFDVPRDYSAHPGEFDYLHSDNKGLLYPSSPVASSTLSADREILVSSIASASIDGVLDVAIHHARDIQNICIYGNQDVYAKFSITHSQDTVYSTQPVRGGGKNPVFNQSMQILISKLDAVLKCEIWMMSSVRTYLEDQLLGFVLVPLADMLGKGKHIQDYTLSSTDLFHTPAGTVCLSLRFYTRDNMLDATVLPSEKPPEVILMENGPGGNDSMDYNRIEFPDLRVMSENQQLVSLYLNMASPDLSIHSNVQGSLRREGDDLKMTVMHKEDSQELSFLHLGSSPMAERDTEMSLMQTSEEKVQEGIVYSDEDNDGDVDVADDRIDEDDDDDDDDNGVSSSGNTSLLAPEAPSSVSALTTESANTLQEAATKTENYDRGSRATPSPPSASSGSGLSSFDERTNASSDGQESRGSFGSPLVNITFESTEPAVQQQQIVDMYMKSMQQFTQSLAKMKLPLDLDGGQSRVEGANTAHSLKNAVADSEKDSHRVFYGSRAFF